MRVENLIKPRQNLIIVAYTLEVFAEGSLVRYFVFLDIVSPHSLAVIVYSFLKKYNTLI